MSYGGKRLLNYHRLVEGLKEIGRRDLIDMFKQNTDLLSGSGSKSLLKRQNDFNFRSWPLMEVKNIKSVPLIPILFVLLLGTFTLLKPRFNYNVLPLPYNFSGIDQQYLTRNIAHHLKIVAFNDPMVTNCSSSENDLPIIHPLFVGRENDVHQVMLKVARAHIVNINGAPGFGKSTLAIHLMRQSKMELQFDMSILKIKCFYSESLAKVKGES